VHPVSDLVEASGLPLEVITKTIIFKHKNGGTIAAVVPSKFRVSAPVPAGARATKGNQAGQFFLELGRRLVNRTADVRIFQRVLQRLR